MITISRLIEELEAMPQTASIISFISLLKQKQEELGENLTQEQQKAAVQECLKVHTAMVRKGVFGNTDNMTEEEEKFFSESLAVVKEFLDENKLSYRMTGNRSRYKVFSFEMQMPAANLHMKIAIGLDPRSCRVDAELPITADKSYEYLICRAICEENYMKRYGAFQYDETDGTLSYRYCFPITHGLYKDDLEKIFLSVAQAGELGHKTLKKHCVGKYKDDELESILEKLNVLVSEISDYTSA